jgi:nucleotide-binding universal stress UspA family protein
MLILIPDVDSVNSLPAVRYVIREFLSGERFEVHLLHVRSPFLLSVSGYPARGKARDARQRAAADQALKPARVLLERLHIRYTVHVEAGDKAQTILAVAGRVKADRIVMGTARHWSVTRLSEESIVRKVFDSAPVPVTLVAGKSVSRVERYGVAAGLGATLVGLILFS